MRKVLGVIGVVSFVAPAVAADLAVKAALYKAPPIAPFSWAGCYVGATLGGVEGKSDVSWAANQAGFPPPIIPPPIQGRGGNYKHGGDNDHKHGDDHKDQ